MPAVYGVASETPCIHCSDPSAAYCYAGIEGLSGRVCSRHAREMADQGRCVVGDRGQVRNWSLAVRVQSQRKGLV